MLKRTAFVAALLIGALVAFVGASWAIRGSSQDLDPSLPASALPRTQVSPTVQAAIQDLIGPAGAGYGISADSFSQVRILTTTEEGPLYVVPGANGGVCDALIEGDLPAASCGHPGSLGETTVSVLVPDGTDTYLVGGGIATTSVTKVVVTARDGKQTHAHAVQGGFAVSSADGLTANGPAVINAVGS